MEKEERSLRPRKRVDYTKTRIDRTPAWCAAESTAAPVDSAGKTMKKHRKKKPEKSEKAPRKPVEDDPPKGEDKRDKRKVKFAEKTAEVPPLDSDFQQMGGSDIEKGPSPAQSRRDQRNASPVRLRKSEPPGKEKTARPRRKDNLSLPGDAQKSPQQNKQQREKWTSKGAPTAFVKKRRQERGPSELEADFGKKSKREKGGFDEKEAMAKKKGKTSKPPPRDVGEMEEVEEISCIRGGDEGGPSNFAGAVLNESEAMEEDPGQTEAPGLNEERRMILSPNRRSEIGRSSFAHQKREYWLWVENQNGARKNWLAEDARKLLKHIDVTEKAVQGMQDSTMFWQKEAEKQALYAIGGKETAARLQQARAEIAEKDAEIAQKNTQLKAMMEKLDQLEKMQEMASQRHEEPPLHVDAEAIQAGGSQTGGNVDDQQPKEGPSEIHNCSVAVQVDPQSPSLVAETNKRVASFATLSRRVSEGGGEQHQPQNQPGTEEFSFCTSPGNTKSKMPSVMRNPMEEHTVEIPTSEKISARRHLIVDLLSHGGTPVKDRNLDVENSTLPVNTAPENFKTPTVARRRSSMIGSGAKKRLSMAANTAQLSTIPESREPFSTKSLLRHSEISVENPTTGPIQKRMSNSRLSYGPLENLEHLGFKVEPRDDGLFHSHPGTGYSFWIGESDIDPRKWLEDPDENFDQTQDGLNLQQICYKPCELGAMENGLPVILMEEVTILKSSAAKLVECIGDALEERLQATGKNR
ncbi:hypothetical protein BSKO_09058 [Bryopsis sp. KO-2023]|nr:hypothetical protein BSKO_09058 [Bryopsis sp. KO-2023]